MFITVGLFMFLSYYLAPGKNPALIPIGKLFGVTIFFQPMRWFIVSYVRIIALLLAAIFYFSSNRERDILVGLRSARVLAAEKPPLYVLHPDAKACYVKSIYLDFGL